MKQEYCIELVEEYENINFYSIHLQNDAVKNKGYGTQAERLAIAYAFDALGVDHILADSVEKNRRSQHVLETMEWV